MRILILHASAGAGHRRAAEALAKAFRRLDEPGEVVVCDILDYTPLMFKQTYAKGYLRLVRRTPELWAYVYSQTDRMAQVPWRNRIRATLNKVNVAKFFGFYEDLRPDAAVCTHFMPLEVLSSRTRRRAGARAPFCAITDFAVHSLWIVHSVHCYYIASEEMQRHLVRRGQPLERTKITGIPIDPVFAEQRDPVEARERLGLRPDLPAVLMVSGGYGVGSVAKLMQAFQGVEGDYQLIAVAGADERMRRKALAAATGLRVPATVYGGVDNIHELMDAADLVITKSGGLTSSEALAKRKPMIITDPIPGQEQRNCEYLLESGAAVRLYETDDAPYRVRSLLESPRRLQELRAAAVRIGHPHAARDVAEDILRRVGGGG